MILNDLNGFENVHFAFADINGNIKVKIKEKIRNRMFFNIRNNKDLADLMVTLDFDNDRVRNFRYGEKDLYPNDDDFCEIVSLDQDHTD